MGRTLEEVFTSINRRCFGNSLPQIALSFSKRRLRNYWAYFVSDTKKPAYIRVSRELESQPVKLMQYMIHEMVHLWQFMRYEVACGTLFLRRDMVHDTGHGHDKEFWMMYNWCKSTMGVL